jgi:HAD superfamily hydrolase (TIGR01509 family)
MKRLLLFDCDGTLVDSELLCNVALVDLLKPLGVALEARTLEKRYRGVKLEDQLSSISQEHQINLNEGFIEDYRAHVLRLCQSDLKPIAGVVEALTKLALPKVVVSNAPTKKVEISLKVCDLRRFFPGPIYSAYDVGIWKPDPGLFLHAAQQSGYAPTECVVIEDGVVGVQAALGAGMKTLYFNPHRDRNPFGEDVVEFWEMNALPTLIAELA